MDHHVDFYDGEKRLHTAAFLSFSPDQKYVNAVSSTGIKLVIPAKRVRNLDKLMEEVHGQ